MGISFYGWKEHTGGTVFTDTDMHLSNRNAQLLMAHLGLEFDVENYSGSWPVAEVRSRCVTALAVGGIFPDDGLATEREGNWIDCGVRPGYYAERTAELLAVCDECDLRGIGRVTYA